VNITTLNIISYQKAKIKSFLKYFFKKIFYQKHLLESLAVTAIFWLPVYSTGQGHFAL